MAEIVEDATSTVTVAPRKELVVTPQAGGTAVMKIVAGMPDAGYLSTQYVSHPNEMSFPARSLEWKISITAIDADLDYETSFAQVSSKDVAFTVDSINGDTLENAVYLPSGEETELGAGDSE